jgi:uncharacterized protein
MEAYAPPDSRYRIDRTLFARPLPPEMTPIVYLHGFASSPSSSKARYFRDLLERSGAIVTIPDLADGDFEHLTITGQLDLLDRAVGGRRVNLMGSSMGGWLAALYAARHPEVQRLVLLAPAFGFNRRWPERLGAAEMDRWRREQALEVFHYGEGRTCRIGFQLIEDAARYDDFPDVHQPTLIFHGATDDIVPASYSQEFAKIRPNVTLDVVNSGHDLLNVLEPIGERVRQFLA